MADTSTRTNGTPRRLSPLTEIGTTGLRHWGGRIHEEFLRAWQTTRRRAATITEMQNNDPVIGAVLFATEMLIRQVTWDVEPADEDTESQRAAAFGREMLQDMSMSWSDTLAEILTFLPYGFFYGEMVLKRRLGPNPPPLVIEGRRIEQGSSKYTDGQWALRKLAPRSQDSLDEWDFDENGSVQGMYQWDWQQTGRRYIPLERALLFRTSSRKGSPEGPSILRPAYIDYYYKKLTKEDQAVGIRRDLAGLPMAYVPPEIMDPDAPPAFQHIYSEVKKVLNNVHVDEQHSIIFPSVFDEHGNRLYEFSLVSSSGQKNFDTIRILEYFDHRIVASVLGSILLMGQDKVGTNALGVTTSELFAMALTAYCDAICDVWNRHCWPRIWKLNGASLDTVPRLTHGKIQRVDLGEFSAYILNMSKAGMPVDDLTNHARRVADLPEMPEEELQALREDERRAQASAARRDAGGPEPKPTEEEGTEAEGAT